MPAAQILDSIVRDVHATRATLARNARPLSGAALASQQARAAAQGSRPFSTVCMVAGVCFGMLPGSAVVVGVFDVVGLYGSAACIGSAVCMLAASVVARRVGL